MARQEYGSMQDGPCGEHNFRRNALTRLLGFSEGQAEDYYDSVVEYNALIEEQREREKNGHGNRERYQSRRDELREEFIEIVTGRLSPEQERQFENLPEFARKPDGPAHMPTNVAMPPGFIPGEAEASHDAPPRQSEG